MSAATRARPQLPLLLLGATALISAVVLLVLQSHLTFYLDEWRFLVDRRGWGPSSFLEPHHEHLSILPVLAYKLLVTTFGMDSQRPFQILLTGVVIANAVLVFVWIRRRLGDWIALAATIPLFFLGSAAFDLLWPFQITLMGSLALGVGALVALDRGDRLDQRGDRLACGLLVASVATSSPGLAFVAGIALGVLVRPDRFRRAYIFCVPLGLYLIWYLIWGVSPDGVTLAAIAHAPVYVLNGFASSIASLLGLVRTPGGAPLDPLTWGRPLLVIALLLCALRLWKLRAVSPMLATVLGTGITFWSLAALSGADREPTNGRYQYLGAVFVLLIVAELWRDTRPGPKTITVCFVIAAAALVGNLRALDDDQHLLATTADATRADLGAAELARDVADPAAVPVLETTVGSYLAAVDAYGSPAFDSDQIAASDESIRLAADQTFAKLLQIAPRPLAGSPTARLDCRMLRLTSTPTAIELPAGGLVVASSEDVGLALRRYVTEAYSVDLGTVAGGQPVAVQVPEDRSPVPWVLGLSGAGAARICPLPTGTGFDQE